MEDDSYIPMYETVDDVQCKVTSKTATSSSEYKALRSEDCIQAEYQVPSVNSNYVPFPGYNEISVEVKILNKSMRRMKVVLWCAGVLMCILLFACIITTVIAVSNRSTRKVSTIEYSNSDNGTYYTIDRLQEKIHALEGNMERLDSTLEWKIERLISTRNLSIFDRCYQENTTCNYRPVNNNSWLTCKTNNLYTKKEVGNCE